MEAKNEERAISVIGLISAIIWEFTECIKTYEDIADLIEIEYEFDLKDWDVKRLMMKGLLNESRIKHILSTKDEDQTRHICSLFDAKKWIGRHN